MVTVLLPQRDTINIATLIKHSIQLDFSCSFRGLVHYLLETGAGRKDRPQQVACCRADVRLEVGFGRYEVKICS